MVQRKSALVGPPLLEAVLSLLGRPIVYDIDDAIYLPPEGPDNWLKRFARCDWRVGFVSRRSLITGVGNCELERYVLNYQKETRMWPTSVDLASYTPRREADENHVPVVGWTGSASTAVFIEPLLPLLRELQQELDFDVLIMGAEFDLRGLGIAGTCVGWSPEVEVPTVKRMDVGLMPLSDSPWTRGKCALKALQYQAVGTPAVVSDVGMNKKAVLDGVTGFVIPVGGDWKEPLRVLLKDRDLRRTMGFAARRHVEVNYSAETVAARVAQDIKIALLSRQERTKSVVSHSGTKPGAKK